MNLPRKYVGIVEKVLEISVYMFLNSDKNSTCLFSCAKMSVNYFLSRFPDFRNIK